MPSSFLLAGMQRSWQEAKQPSWRVRKPHTEDEGKKPGCLDHVEASSPPTWPAYLDFFLERKLHSCNKPKRTFCVFFHRVESRSDWPINVISTYRDEKSLPRHSQCEPGFKHNSDSLPPGSNTYPGFLEKYTGFVQSKKTLHFPYRPQNPYRIFWSGEDFSLRRGCFCPFVLSLNWHSLPPIPACLWNH